MVFVKKIIFFSLIVTMDVIGNDIRLYERCCLNHHTVKIVKK